MRSFYCEDCGNFTVIQYAKDERKKCKSCKARETRLRNPNVPVQLAENLVVTKAVIKRLNKQAKAEIPLSRAEKIGGLIQSLSWAVNFPVTYFIAKAIIPDSDYVLLWLFLGSTATLLVNAITERLLEKPTKERINKIERRIAELAEKRKQAFEQARLFYSSPEWSLMRMQVIEEKGRICAMCRRMIKKDIDLTIDHVRPRSKYPELALDISNLQVLCRRCNSSKGATLVD